MLTYCNVSRHGWRNLTLPPRKIRLRHAQEYGRGCTASSHILSFYVIGIETIAACDADKLAKVWYGAAKSAPDGGGVSVLRQSMKLSEKRM